MECKLTRSGHDYYEPLRWPSFSCETMRESIVPDSCPDIARIIDTVGAVYLTGRELTGDGRCSASGSVDVAVLYIPEKGEGPRVLRFQLPFQCYGDSLGTGECDFLDIRGELRGIDTRALNPRKVLTRANIDLYPSCCRRVRLELCDGAEEEQEDLQLLREERTCRVVAAVREREFTFVEELPVSAGRAGGEEAVQLRCDVRSNDVKLIGSKLVVKGLISASLLYREEGGRLALLQQDLPFSQILDGAGLEEDWDSEAAFRLLSAECRLGSESAPDDAHVFTVTLLLRTRVTVCRQERMGYIADLYSTAGEIDCQTETLRLTEDAQRVVRRQNVRELLETGVGVKSVVDASVVCGAAQVGGSALEIPVSARCLYLDENDALRSVTREFTASCPAELPEGFQAEGEAVCRGEMMTSVLPEGIELRFPLECTLELCRRTERLCVSAGERRERPEDQEPQPSLILRKFSGDETLWAVAKQYRTTAQAILSVNGAESEAQLPRDRLLLVPRAR